MTPLPKRIHLYASRYILGGRIAGWSYPDLNQALSAEGASPHFNMRGADFCVVGQNCPREKINAAHQSGVPLLDVTQLNQLLRDGYLDLESGEKLEPSNVHELMGEMRSLLDRPVSATSWLQALALIERCIPQDRETFMHYLRGTRPHWSGDLVGCTLDKEFRSKWLGHMTPVAWQHTCDMVDELFGLAPPRWIDAMREESYAPWHALIHTINLEYIPYTSDQCALILRNPHLKHVRAFMFSTTRACMSEEIKALKDAAFLGTLEHLVIQVDVRTFNRVIHLADGDIFPSLKHITVIGQKPPWEDTLAHRAFIKPHVDVHVLSMNEARALYRSPRVHS